MKAMPQILQITASAAARAFDASGREAHTAQVQRAMREMGKGTACALFARPAFSGCGKAAEAALQGRLDFSPTTLTLYVLGDLTDLVPALNRLATQSIASVARLDALFGHLADAGEQGAEQVLRDKAEEEARARNLAVLAAIAAGAKILTRADSGEEMPRAA